MSGRDERERTYQSQFCWLRFYKRNGDGHDVLCNEEDNWETCVVTPTSAYSGYGEQWFGREDEYRRDALLSLLGQAFEAGRRAKAREIKRALEV